MGSRGVRGAGGTNAVANRVSNVALRNSNMNPRNSIGNSSTDPSNITNA